MEKYLFTDGTSGVKEVQSADELKTLVQACPDSYRDPSKIRIWKFNTSEWITFGDLAKEEAKSFELSAASTTTTNNNNAVQSNGNGIEVAKKRSIPRLREFFYILFAVVAGFFLYNFTRIKWETAGAINQLATRPENCPKLDVDSLIAEIENTRGQPLDKITRVNFRLRNTWPDKISLKLTADRFTNRSTNKYSNIELTLDNSTGYDIDNAVVQLNTWKKADSTGYSISKTDTVQFSNISYVLPVKRKIDDTYRGDSISVSFFSIKAKSFNFYYSADKQSNYGNMNDRWFWNPQAP
jgi:hypothetical protein